MTGIAERSPERLDRRGEAAVGEHRRGDAAREVAQLADRGARLVAGAAHELGDLGPVAQALLGAAEQHAQRDEPRLRAVVQVALDAAQLRRLDVERAAARAGQLVDALDQLALARLGQPLAVDDERVRPERQREAEQRPAGQNAPKPASAQTMRIAPISPVTWAWTSSRLRARGRAARTPKASAWMANGIASPNQTQTGQN